MSRSLVWSLSQNSVLRQPLIRFKQFHFLPKENGGNVAGKWKVSHAADALGGDEDSHTLPEAVRKVSQRCLMDKN